MNRSFQSTNIFKVIGFVGLILIGGVWLYPNYLYNPQNEAFDVEKVSDLQNLFEEQQSGVMVYTYGNVTRILADDNKGSRHQRFIFTTSDGLSLLVAHNIDLGFRIPLKIGDQIVIYGQYEWNNKGGIIHWTHHDPKNQHPGGWIIHNNVKYE